MFQKTHNNVTQAVMRSAGLGFLAAVCLGIDHLRQVENNWWCDEKIWHDFIFLEAHEVQGGANSDLQKVH